MPGKENRMKEHALLIGNSDGIGLTLTRELLGRGWQVTGISRSESPVRDPSYRHIVEQVQNTGYLEKLESVLQKSKPVDLCIYCAGIGELLDTANMENETETVEVNLLGMIKTASRVIPGMVRRQKGHVIGVSSVADAMVSAEAPAYHASKAGFSNYLEGLALAVRPKGVFVSNVRFGFVNTKMAKGEIRPFMIGVERAAQVILACMEKKPIRFTAPRIVLPMVKFRNWMLYLKILTGKS
jgi:short-subunit dehydrogenase